MRFTGITLMSKRWFTPLSCLLPWLSLNARADEPAFNHAVPRATLKTSLRHTGFFGERWEFTRP